MKSLNHDEAKPRGQGVVVIGDVSGSMGKGGNIEALNTGMCDLGAAFQDMASENPDIHFFLQGVIFGGGVAKAVLPEWTQPAEFKWPIQSAYGDTPMGKGISEVTRQLSLLPKGCLYYPSVVVLLSDGHPTDEWQVPLGLFQASAHGRKAKTFSIAVGADADRACLGKFSEGSEIGVLEVSDAAKLVDAIVFNTLEASHEAIAGKSVTGGASLPFGSRHSVINGDLPELSINESIVDSASRENRLW